jgi:hypothetical protein
MRAAVESARALTNKKHQAYAKSVDHLPDSASFCQKCRNRSDTRYSRRNTPQPVTVPGILYDWGQGMDAVAICGLSGRPYIMLGRSVA